MIIETFESSEGPSLSRPMQGEGSVFGLISQGTRCY